jgi:Mrp family chromosome partitioning ATPase
MERIQTAIAKARAARDGHVAGKPKAPPPANLQSRDAWIGLTEVTFDDALLEAGRIVAHRPSHEAGVFDVMRTNLLRQLRERGWKRVAITSPGVACGKTMTSLNLAFSLARQQDLKVMLLELDLRRPSICKTLGINTSRSFSAVLDGSEPMQNQLLRWGSNLAFGVNTVAVPSPAELLSSVRAADIIDAMEAHYQPDVLIFDMPPMLASDDTIAFLDQVDCALMVAAAEQSTVGEIDRCGKQLAEHTQVLGVILNKCRFMDSDEGYGYGSDY